MELGAHHLNFFSGAIVGGSVIFPLGAAFAQKFTGSDAISVTVIGDGSFDEGILYRVYESGCSLCAPAAHSLRE